MRHFFERRNSRQATGFLIFSERADAFYLPLMPRLPKLFSAAVDRFNAICRRNRMEANGTERNRDERKGVEQTEHTEMLNKNWASNATNYTSSAALN